LLTLGAMTQTPAKKLAPSLLSADFAALGDACEQARLGGADWLHVDVMDGDFVPNLTIGPCVVRSLAKKTTLPLDCHLMVRRPELLVPLFADAGASNITVHVESTVHLDRLLNQIRERGCTCGVALNPATPIESVRPVLDVVDLVLVMSVNPGFGGQKLIPYCLDKVRALRDLRPELDVQIDGGVKLDNLRRVLDSGATNIVAGSAIFETADVAATTKAFKRAM